MKMRKKRRRKRMMRTRNRLHVKKNRVSMMIQSKLGKGRKIYSKKWRILILNGKIKKINFLT
jgi:hypothetical protein